MITAAAAERMWSRKFLLATAAQVANIALFAFGTLSEEGFVTLTIALLGGFVAGNVAQHIWEPKRNVQVSHTQDGPDPHWGGSGGSSSRSVSLSGLSNGPGQREPGTDEGAREITQRAGEVDR